MIKVKVKYKKGQVAIWVILASILVASLLIFFFVQRKIVTSEQENVDINSYIEKCVKDNIKEVSEKIMLQGGILEPENYRTYKKNKVTYLCEHIGNFEPCIQQHSALHEEIRTQIQDYLAPKVEQCFISLKDELEKINTKVEMGQQNLEITLGSKRIYSNITRKVVLTKEGNAREFTHFSNEIISPLYDLSKIAIEIANQEAKYCYFDTLGYTILAPEFDIRKYTFSDSTTIYTIKDKQSEKEMNIAIRSCAIPAGVKIS